MTTIVLIRKNNEVTLTNGDMTRFFLTLKQAIDLVFKSILNSHGGEIFVMKMPAAKIIDLANLMVEELGDSETKIREIGIRPGEKIHEALVSRYDTHRTLEDEGYFIILPNIKINGLEEKYARRKKVDFHEFNSTNTIQMDKEKLKDVLEKDGWLSQTPGQGFLEDIDPEQLKFQNKKWL